VKEHEVAVRLHPEYRTEPNVYYIPPFAPPQHSERGESLDSERIPRNYLEELFGPEVNEALNTIERERDKVERGEESEVMDLLTTENPAKQYRLEVFDEE
jgi:nitrate reductase beta subunit